MNAQVKNDQLIFYVRVCEILTKMGGLSETEQYHDNRTIIK
jgi:hypothetical protein